MKMNSVSNLLRSSFSTRSWKEQLEIKLLGRPMPRITLVQKSKSKTSTYCRKFNPALFKKHLWMCGCEIANALFCFPCLLFGGDPSWSSTGVTDLQHIHNKIKKHESSYSHINNEVTLGLFRSKNLDLLHSEVDYELRKKQLNENASLNRRGLLKILDCVKLCGEFELALPCLLSLRRSSDRSIFDFACDLDTTLKDHLKTSPVFQEATQILQQELLACVLEVCRGEIATEIANAEFVAMMVDETTGVSSSYELALVFRFVLNGKPVERFWGFLNTPQDSGASLSKTILDEINPLLQKCPRKLIAQSYSGSEIMNGRVINIHVDVKEAYASAHFVHCYAHPLNLIMEQAASQNHELLVFFANLSKILTLFSNPPLCIGLAIPLHATGNSKFPSVGAVLENREALISFMNNIENTSKVEQTISQAMVIRTLLLNSKFVFWLAVFYHIMPHVDILNTCIQRCNANPAVIKKAITAFVRAMNQLQENMKLIVEEAFECSSVLDGRRRPCNEAQIESRTTAAREACGVMVTQAELRFNFTGHLEASRLLQRHAILLDGNPFPQDVIDATAAAYTIVNKAQLESELSVMSKREEFMKLSTALPLLSFIYLNNIDPALKETVKLLKIILTTPMSPVGTETSYLDRIKTFFQKTTAKRNLNALAMLSVNKEFIRGIPDFNQRVIERFSNLANRRAEFCSV